MVTPRLGDAGICDGQQGGCGVAKQTLRTRFVGLVFNAYLAFAVVVGDLANSLDFPVPRLGVVELEVVIEAVLAEPDGHQLHAHRTGGIYSTLGEIDRLPPHGFIRIREGASLEAGICIVSHGQAVDRQTHVADAA